MENTATETVIPDGAATTQVQTAGNQTTGDPSTEPAPEIPSATQPVIQPETQPDLEDETPIDTAADHHTNHATIRFTDSNADIWPPQPTDITNVAEVTAVDFARPGRQMPDRERFANLDTDVAILLGERYEVLASHTIRNKSDVVTHIETEIFAYDTNQVITVEFSADGGTIIGHTVTFAHQYQPPESQQEVERAISLAKDALSAQGFSDHLVLKGTGLLAYPTATETAATGHQFFSQRKIYVTFGTGNGELPQYRALVNLSNSTVESSGAIQ